MTDLAERLAGLTPAKRQLLEQRLRSEGRVAEPIAIVGMACRLPGAGSLEEFWRVIRDGVDATGPIPSTRWDVDSLFDPTGEQPGKMSVRWAGLVDDVDKFDPQFFGISPREASRMDPQQRLLLEVAWEALEIAGWAPERMGGTATGVFVGIGGTDYSKIPAQFEDYYQHIDAHVGTGNALSIASNRVSYILDLRGPSLSVDTACSSGLLGVHLAVQSLRNRECDAALAGGVNLILSPETTIAFSKARMLSPDGHCRPFDAGANGYVRGEGCGMIVLKRLTDAVRDGDGVLAVIRGTAANQDGRTSGITAPSGRAQQAVIRAALAQAGLTTDRVSYIEAHGTGTPLGDPIETQALAEVFRRRTDRDPPLHVSSVKANIGHTETVSGIAGIIKVVLMLRHGLIPAQLHLQTLNPHLGLEDSRVRIPTAPTAWQPAGPTRVAGVSSFGFGGTNTHIVLEETSPAALAPTDAPERPLHVLALSAKSESGLTKLAARYADYLDGNPQAAAADVCYGANAGRSHFNHRAIVTARDAVELCGRLRALHSGGKSAGVKAGRARLIGAPKIAFLFTGQGAQYAGMGRSLFQTQPVFRRTLQQCDEILRGCRGQPLWQTLYGDPANTALLDETAYTQPALFALEISLARLWQSWGIEPAALIGHSVGEYVAACVAGVFSLEDGLRLIATRSALMQQLPRDGLMAVVFAPADRVAHRVEPFRDAVAVAAANGPENTVIAGAAEAVRELVRQFTQAGVGSQLLTVSHAFHSPQMDPILDEFQAAASKFQYQRPQIPLVSNLTGRLIGDEPLDAAYWRRHVRGTVRFAEGMRTLAEQELHALLEVGPTASLLGMGRRCLPDWRVPWLPSLRKGQDDWSSVLASLSELYVLGARIDWQGFDRDYRRQRLILPTYPFEHERYWFEPAKSPRRIDSTGPGPMLHPLLGNRIASALPTQLFTARLSCHWPKYLVDHQVQGSPVFPAAGYVEQALAAADQMFGPGSHALENLSIQHAMFLPEAIARNVQMAVSPESGGACSFETYSLPVDGESDVARWSLHACGAVRRELAIPPEITAVDLDQVRGRAVKTHAHDEFYRDIMSNRGLAYGPTFRSIQYVYHTPIDALAEVRLPPDVQRELAGYRLHPSLGDAMFQAASGIIPLEADGSYSPYTYMPMGVRRLRVLGAATERMFAYSVRRSPEDRPSPESVEGDVFLVDDQGRVLVEMLGVRVQRVGRGRAAERTADIQQWLYQVAWLPAALKPAATAPRMGRWLIFADRQGVAQPLASGLRQASGQRAVLVVPGDGFRILSTAGDDTDETYQIDPLAADDYGRLLSEAFAGEHAACAGIVHLWSLDLAAPEDAPSDAAFSHAWDEARRRGCGSVLQLIRQIVRFHFSPPPELWLATQGAQSTGDDQADVSVGQSPLWGLGRVAALEHPELACRMIDADPAADPASVAAQVLQELTGSADEDQVAYRGGRRLVARLRRAREVLSDAGPAGSAGPLTIPAAGAFRLRLGAAGSFDALRYESCRRPAPRPGQVEVRVHATGLNFSDVLKAMGLYPGITDEIVPLGIECAGVVTALGTGVERFRVGDAVLGVVPYSLASHALTAEYALAPKPQQLTDAEAATIPITFLTAYYGLVRLAQLQPGERVLIHAAAGGVGLAAIQIAQQIGAEVFATAGSDAKREFLRSLGVPHVFSSRTLDFADEILEVTGRQGVDVVLNSLPGDAITKSLALLRAYGRFLEIGKTDIYQNRMIGLLPFQDNLSYFALDLDRLLRQRPETVRGLFAEVLEQVERGAYRPLPLTAFAAEQTAEAFRYMAQRKNIGKVVVHLGDAANAARAAGEAASETLPTASTGDASGAAVRPDGTYLITGGLGALGQHVTDWLAAQGARYVALLSRRGPPVAVAERLDQLRSQGVAVAVLCGDAADRRSLAEALAQIPQEFPPLRGVLHAAGVLDDGLLFDMTLEQLERPMAPKVQGAWNLHAATRETPLDFFVLFSSVASVLGSPGQANYAAGNAFLDALAGWRHRRGLPALSVNWGPWADAGMAAEAGRADQLQSRGMGLLPPPAALELLGTLLRNACVNVAVMDAQWSAMLRRMSGRVPPLLRDIADQEAGGERKPAADAVDHAFRQRLLVVEMDQRAALLREYFADELCRIMGIERAQLELDQPLNDIGMDSLLAMELKTNLELRLAFSLPMAAFLERPSVTSLAGHAAKSLVAGMEDAVAATAASPGEQLASWSPLVCLQPAGEGPALFCVHPLGGDVNCYRDFARQVQDRPVHALRGRGSEGRFPPHAAMDEMIADYIQAVHAVQPRGPYHLASWSAGGMFSYELARALRMQGEEVGLLMLFDTPLPSIYDNISLDDDIRFLFDLGKFANWFSGSDIDVDSLSYDELRTMDDSTRWEFALQIAKTHGAVPPETSTDHIRRVVEAAKAHARMILNYPLAPFDQVLHLVRPEQPDVLSRMTGQTLGPDLGWGQLIGDRLRLHTAPGDHFSMILGENARRLAELVNTCR